MNTEKFTLPLGQSQYSPAFTAPMEQELVSAGVEALHSAQDVETFLSTNETKLVMVNSVCGCAAGSARPGLILALQHAKKPAKVGTVFAGVYSDSTRAFRAKIPQFPPSSPSIFLFKGNECVFAMHRTDIQGRSPEEVAAKLTVAFDQFC